MSLTLTLVTYTHLTNYTHTFNKSLQALAKEISYQLKKAELVKKEAAELAAQAEEAKKNAAENTSQAVKQTEALLALQEALVSVVETEQDPDLKKGLTIQTKRHLMEIISPVKDDPEKKKPKLDGVIAKLKNKLDVENEVGGRERVLYNELYLLHPQDTAVIAAGKSVKDGPGRDHKTEVIHTDGELKGDDHRHDGKNMVADIARKGGDKLIQCCIYLTLFLFPPLGLDMTINASKVTNEKIEGDIAPLEDYLAKKVG